MSDNDPLRNTLAQIQRNLAEYFGRAIAAKHLQTAVYETHGTVATLTLANPHSADWLTLPNVNRALLDSVTRADPRMTSVRIVSGNTTHTAPSPELATIMRDSREAAKPQTPPTNTDLADLPNAIRPLSGSEARVVLTLSIMATDFTGYPAQLARLINMSRPTLRKALANLQRNGVITITHAVKEAPNSKTTIAVVQRPWRMERMGYSKHNGNNQ